VPKESPFPNKKSRLLFCPDVRQEYHRRGSNRQAVDNRPISLVTAVSMLGVVVFGLVPSMGPIRLDGRLAAAMKDPICRSAEAAWTNKVMPLLQRSGRDTR
jgi:hypothetical protein